MKANTNHSARYAWAPEGVLTAEHTAAFRVIVTGVDTAQALAEARQISPRMAEAILADLADARLIHNVA